MKRIASILLLSILVFNWFGYQLLTSYFQSKADFQLKSRLDDNRYSESELISIKVPAENLGYYVNSQKFERVDGKIEINGIQYNYVKRRVYNDTVELFCIPNHTAMQIKSAKDEFFKLVNDLQQPGQNKKSDAPASSYNSFSTEYYATQDAFDLGDLHFTVVKRYAQYRVTIPSNYRTPQERPPDFC
ncbi:MAG: hypothetical protein C5B59_04085 [Bacteroidetes bacterium]|nr:MAG: hypothetical protein C5B59_04085 [Bacteroidota bacterium]